MYNIGNAFKQIEDDLIGSMIRNLDHHRAEELKEGFNWSQWQVEQLAALEEYKKRNLKKYKGVFGDINNRIDEIIAMQRQAGKASQEIGILKAIKEGAKLHKANKKAGIDGRFFKTNDRKLNALVKATKNDFKKAEYAMLRMSNDRYRQVIFNAQVYANMGAGTYEKAVDMATKDFLRAGINCVEYKNGSRHTVEDYTDMAIRTAGKRAYLTGEGEKRKEWGISTVIMNKRGNPCPLCLPFVGKVLIDDVWSGGSSKDGNYPLMSSAIAKGLYHPRCRDHHTTYFEFLHEDEEPPAKEEKEELISNYNQEQKVNYAKGEAEKYERMEKYSLDPENKRKYKDRKKAWKEKIDIASSTTSDIMKLSDEDLGALKNYKSFDAYIINVVLRNTDDIGLLSKEQQDFVKKMDCALSKMKTYQGNLLRTIDFSDYPNKEDMTRKFIEEYEVGKTIKTKQYCSAAKKTGYNENAGIKIFIQDSKKGRDISEIGLDENEVLYERNTNFSVISKEKKDGIWYILLSEV